MKSCNIGLTLTLTFCLVITTGHVQAEDNNPQAEPVTTEALVSQFQDLMAQIQQHPDVQKLTDSLTSGDWLNSLNSLWDEYTGIFSQMTQEAENEVADLKGRVETFAQQADEVLADGNPYDDAIGKAKAAAQAFEEKMQERKEILDSIE